MNAEEKTGPGMGGAAPGDQGGGGKVGAFGGAKGGKGKGKGKDKDGEGKAAAAPRPCFKARDNGTNSCGDPDCKYSHDPAVLKKARADKKERERKDKERREDINLDIEKR